MSTLPSKLLNETVYDERCPTRKYPVRQFNTSSKDIFGGYCIFSWDIKPNDCQKFVDSGKLGKKGEKWATYTSYLKPANAICPDGDKCINCTLGTGFRQCIKTGWLEENKIPCCSRELDSANDCDPTWCPYSKTCNSAIDEYCTKNNYENLNSKRCQQFMRNKPKLTENFTNSNEKCNIIFYVLICILIVLLLINIYNNNY